MVYHRRGLFKRPAVLEVGGDPGRRDIMAPQSAAWRARAMRNLPAAITTTTAVAWNRPAVQALVAAAGERASMRFLEFFAASIRNPHTRRAYYRAAEEFLAWCARQTRPVFDRGRRPRIEILSGRPSSRRDPRSTRRAHGKPVAGDFDNIAPWDKG
jgi:hypothetical protein